MTSSFGPAQSLVLSAFGKGTTVIKASSAYLSVCVSVFPAFKYNENKSKCSGGRVPEAGGTKHFMDSSLNVFEKQREG